MGGWGGYNTCVTLEAAYRSQFCPPTMYVQGWNLGCQSWRQAPFCVEPSRHLSCVLKQSVYGARPPFLPWASPETLRSAYEENSIHTSGVWREGGDQIRILLLSPPTQWQLPWRAFKAAAALALAASAVI